ncbi:MAG: AI-2E family transporter [Patescibacteria group bacterium]
MNIDISWGTLWKIFFMLLLAAGLFMAREVIIILFLSIVISSAIDSPVSFLQRKRIPRILGTILIFLAVLAVISLLLYIIVPVSIFELKNLLANMDKMEVPFLGKLDTIALAEKLGEVLNGFGNVLVKGGVSSFLSVVSGIFGNIVFVLATFVLSFYLSVHQAGVEKFLRAILPMAREDYVVDIYLRVKKKLGFWLQGQLLLMFFVGFSSFLGLWILGVKYALILGIMAGLFEIVPIVGPIFVGALAFLAAVPESFSSGIYVILLFFLIQQLESHVVVPVVMGRIVGISPVVIVISLLAGSQIAGFVGLVLAVPAAVIFQEIIEDRDRKKPKSLTRE